MTQIHALGWVYEEGAFKRGVEVFEFEYTKEKLLSTIQESEFGVFGPVLMTPFPNMVCYLSLDKNLLDVFLLGANLNMDYLESLVQNREKIMIPETQVDT